MEGYHESTPCSRDTYPASYITQYTSIRRLRFRGLWVWGLGFGVWGLGCGVRGVGLGVRAVGSGVWGSGFSGLGVWGLGFGV